MSEQKKPKNTKRYMSQLNPSASTEPFPPYDDSGFRPRWQAPQDLRLCPTCTQIHTQDQGSFWNYCPLCDRVFIWSSAKIFLTDVHYSPLTDEEVDTNSGNRSPMPGSFPFSASSANLLDDIQPEDAMTATARNDDEDRARSDDVARENSQDPSSSIAPDLPVRSPARLTGRLSPDAQSSSPEAQTVSTTTEPSDDRPPSLGDTIPPVDGAAEIQHPFDSYTPNGSPGSTHELSEMFPKVPQPALPRDGRTRVDDHGVQLHVPPLNPERPRGILRVTNPDPPNPDSPNRFDTPRASQGGESSKGPAVMSAEDFLNSPKAQMLLKEYNKTMKKHWKKREANTRKDPVWQFMPLPKVPLPMLDGLVIRQPQPIETPTDPARLAEIKAENHAAQVTFTAARRAAEAKREPYRKRQRQIAEMTS